MKHWSNYFTRRGACSKALVEVEKYPTFQAWWDICEQADWMLWGLSKLNPIPIEFWKSVVMCAHSALPNFESVFPDDDRPRKAIETRERWILEPNSVTDNELKSAESAARLAALVAARSAEPAAWLAAWSAEAAVWSAAESAAEAAAWSTVESTTLKELSDKIREIMPKVPEVESEVN